MLKQVEITYGKGKVDKFITEHGYTNIHRFAQQQAILKGTQITNIKILQLSK